MTNRPKSFYDGYESKAVEINSIGFEAARDKLNLDYPVGVKYKGSSEGFYFMQGEAQALLENGGGSTSLGWIKEADQ